MSRLESAGLMLMAICWVMTARAQQDAEPEIDFLEYLGSWEGEDEEWFVEAEIDGAHKADLEPKEQRDSDERD